MNKKIQILTYTGVTILISLLLAVTKENLFLAFIDHLFLFSLLLLMVGAVMFILQGGFFTGIIYSFKQFSRRISKRSQYIAEQTGEKDATIKEYSFTATYPLLLSGGFLFLTSTLSSLLFF